MVMTTPLRRALQRVVYRAAHRLRGDDYTRPDGSCRRAPEWLVLGINNACDLKCRMCDVGLGAAGTVFWRNLIGDRRQNMTQALLDAILQQAAGFWPRPKIGLAFTEPLNHPHILDFSRTIVERGFYCQITSNGSMLPRVAERLVHIGIDELVLSVDGPPDAHDRIRGRNGSFQKIFDGVTRLNAVKTRLSRRRPRVGLSFTVTDANYNRVLDFVRAVEPLRPAVIHIANLNFISQPMADTHNASYDGDLRVVPSCQSAIDPAQMPVEDLFDELQQVRRYVQARGADAPRLHIAPDANDPATLRLFYQDHLTFVGDRRCTDPWKMMMIKTDGTVIPAHGRCYDYPVGNVTGTPLTSIWNGPRFLEFRRTLRDAGGALPACARCCGVIGKPRNANRAN
jgi:MoaA/NifB/PqqE/SkfB family radical SAM enzyme